MSMTIDTFERPPAGTAATDPRMMYIRSYLLIRTTVGAIGLLSPFVLALGDWFFVAHAIGAKGLPSVPQDTGPWQLLHLRGSISAYYHTDVGDLFVAGLASIGLLLILYLAGQWRRWDCPLSTVAGVALLGVVFFPTTRPGKVIPVKDVVPQIACGQQPTPTDCAPMQTWLGEAVTAGIHFSCAFVFIALLAALSFIFARRMATYEPANPFRHVQTACGWLIIAALAWVAIGHFANIKIFGLTPLYVAEVISVWAFATSWLLKGLSLQSLVGARPLARLDSVS